MQKLLLVEDDPALQFTIKTALEVQGYAVDAVSTTGEAIERLDDGAYPIVITDIYIDERTGIDVLNAAKRRDPRCAVILMTGRGTVETVMEATRGGAFDYIAKPFELDTMLGAVTRAEAARNDNEPEAEEEDLPESSMIGSSAAMVEVYKKVTRVAPTDATVVIEGETGTGKELVARMVHRFSQRSKQAFVAVDCAAIAPSLLESELFGAMRGAFTGADRDRVGVFEAANRGTVFLDEIGEIEKSFQANLLRFLQEREIRPVGASRAKEVDVRVICATNRDLQRMVDDGKFREDLWYRLNTVRIVLPPLRERRDDIPLLARFYVNKYNGRYNREVRLMDSGVREFQNFTWPGNVRQLQHVVERLVILSDRIDSEAVLDALTAMDSREKPVETLADAEEDQIRKVLAATGGNKSKAAQILGIERKTLYRKLERMKL
ncbi:MAG: two component, sigma54 specific, transcriptional regulator, Fis family [Candidatus Solibacter sp.]|nr:two component, sigma54 specific, transcriptional regulator, Fis family [Candidatus Solibacter sp.]